MFFSFHFPNLDKKSCVLTYIYIGEGDEVNASCSEGVTSAGTC